MLGHYLMFNRNCSQALETYKQAFGATVLEMQTYGDLPQNPTAPITQEDKDLVLHSRFEIDGSVIMAADSTHGWHSGGPILISVDTEDETWLQQAWDTLRQGGEVHLNLAPTFFAKLHGSLRDAYGINWMFTLS
ncbi:MAG: VOC family protein [Micrococcales bacterium]|nr:VOC family protein [Micrococcales bacterium]